MSAVGFPGRLRVLVRLLGNQYRLARGAGLGANVIGKYASRGSEPTRPSLIALANAAGVNLLWLASGEGPIFVETTDDASDLSLLLLRLAAGHLYTADRIPAQALDRAAFAARMQQTARRAGGVATLSTASGLSQHSTWKYCAGVGEPLRPSLVAIASAAKVNLLWLATGVGPAAADAEALPPENGWYSVSQLAGLPGLPRSSEAVRRIAKAEGWPSRPRAGLGGGREYHLDGLPPETRAHLLSLERGDVA